MPAFFSLDANHSRFLRHLRWRFKLGRGLRVIIGASVFAILCLWRISNVPYKKFIFEFGNTPYTKLNNAKCVLQSRGQWDCPDIRTQGQNKIRQSQLVATRMLLIFDALCKKHGFRYWITRGSLIGAARHQGHVPWDTDTDIEMPIEDYVEFVRKAVEELPPGMILQHHHKEDQYLRQFNLTKTALRSHEIKDLAQVIKTPWNPRLRDDGSCFRNCLNEGCSWHDGLMIDIYPIVLSNGFYTDQFQFAIWRFILRLRGVVTKYQAFPLKSLEFEGFRIPVPNEWKRFLRVTYGENHMDIPPSWKQRPPGDVVPEPLHACSEFDGTGNLKIKRISESKRVD